MRSESLSTANSGMTRLRRKGNASPATLYDCLNAYITIAGTVKPRPGTVIHKQLPAGTKGLVAHRGKQYVFSHQYIDLDDERYALAILKHPNSPNTPIAQIDFAQPFMGYIYVVATFEDGQIWHFFTEELDAWEADTVYAPGARVSGSDENGFVYRAERIASPSPVWEAGAARAVNDVIEPTVPNGFEYVCIATTGANPKSGAVEPDWPTVEGATVVEESEGGTTTPTAPSTGGDGTINPIDPRYGNPSYGDARFLP